MNLQNRIADFGTLSCEADLAGLALRFRGLLFEKILPLWSTVGADFAAGGYAETLNLDGKVPAGPRRVRVSARQVYAFCEAAKLGWNRTAAAASVRHGIRFLVSHCSADGLLVHSIAGDDSLIDRGYDLYDQAFLLFAYAHAYELLGDRDVRSRALALRRAIDKHFAHWAGGYSDHSEKPFPLRANPHMHLLEAALAWAAIDNHPAWRQLADDIVGLLKARFVDMPQGPVRETFDQEWQPLEQDGHHRIEPGHNYEWAWLLLRWQALTEGDAGGHPLCMIEFAERLGYDPSRHVAVNEVWSDGSPCDPRARLWPQTERLKAWLAVAAEEAGEGRRQAEGRACDAAAVLLRYLETGSEGLWHDVMLEDGSFAPGAAPASSLYHIICAIGELVRYAAAGQERAMPEGLAMREAVAGREAMTAA